MTAQPLRDWHTAIAPPAIRSQTIAGRTVEQAEWDSTAATALAANLEQAGVALAALAPNRVESAWCETVEAFRRSDSPERRSLAGPLAATCRLSAPALVAGLDAVLGGVAGPAAQEIFAQAAASGASRSPALLVLASNLPALAVQPLLPAVALRRPTLIKSPSAEPLFAAAFVRSLTHREPALARALAALAWPGGDAQLEAPLLAAAGRVIAYGEQSSLDDLSRRAPGKVIGYGPMTSLAAVDAACEPREVAPGLARDIALFDQRGCLSIAAVYTAGDAEALASSLSEELAELARRWPPFAPDPRSAAAVQQLRAEAELHGWSQRSLGLSEGTILVDPRPAFRPSPGLRTVRVHPLDDLRRLPELLAPWTGRLQGVAVAGPVAGSLDWRALGVSRTAPPGELQTPDASWHNGGRHPLEALAGDPS